MPLEQQRSGDPTTEGECRRCRTFCDKVIEPRGCLAQRCHNLYSYEDNFSGKQFMGCLRKVFRAEVDVEMFELAENAGGFGGLKMTGDPLPQCQFKVEPSFEGKGSSFECVNPRFFDCSDGMNVFDLRAAL